MILIKELPNKLPDINIHNAGYNQCLKDIEAQRVEVDIRKLLRITYIARDKFGKGAGEMWNQDGEDWSVAKALKTAIENGEVWG